MYKKGLLILILILGVSATNVTYQPNRLMEVKAALCLRMADHLIWPENDSTFNYKVGLYKPDSLTYTLFKNISMIVKVKQHYVSISSFSEIEQAKQYSIVYLNDETSINPDTIVNVIKGLPIILVTNNCLKPELVMLNITQSGHNTKSTSFSVNKKNVIEQNIEVKPTLLLLGGTEIDIRELYKKTEKSLIAEKERVEIQKQQLDEQTKNIVKQKNVIDSQRIEIALKEKHLTNLSQNLKRSEDSIIKMAKQLTGINQLIKHHNETIEMQKYSINYQQNEITHQQKTLNTQKEELSIGQHEIAKQRSILKQQNSIIGSQQATIKLITVLAMLILVLMLLTLRGLVQNNKKKRELELQNVKIAQQKANLEKQAEQLNTANHELESFSYSVSHDLRAPLRSIDGFSQALLEDNIEQLDETGSDYLKRIRAASQKMAVLIDDLLRLSRISRQILSINNVDLSNIAQQILDEYKASEPTRQVICRVQPNLTVTADPQLIAIALQNLLGNAWKYTAKQREAMIVFKSEIINNETVYEISDNGIGFDMQYADKLFGAFQRLHSNNEFQGTGIGLSIVHRIITKHNGKIWFQSTPNIGTTFYFKL